ncbi:MAG TPA: hypothetical protein VJ579_02095 [Candidatus Paceibacterota bacterium]|nr:hypothetical protein [Candidatus Paceibacterota bacterium]
MARPSKKEGVISQFGAPDDFKDLGPGAFSEKKFTEIQNLRRTVRIPADYVSATQISRHPAKGAIGTDNYIDPLVLKAAAVVPTDELVPGAKYDVRFYAIGGKLSSTEGLRFLREQRSLQIGVPGLSIIYDLLKGNLPCDRWVVALDDRGHLFKDEFGSYRVPMIKQPIAASSAFLLGHFANPWQNRQVLISVVRIG